jgi:predicted ATPase
VQISIDRYPSLRPAIHLRRDGWDDFGFKTLYWATLLLSSDRPVDLGAVKILELGVELRDGRVALEGVRARLGERYCSLGQQPSYYEALRAADDEEPGVEEACLEAMSDVVFDPGIYERFRGERGFEVSLLREAGARQALDFGRSLYNQAPSHVPEGRLAIDYISPGASDPFRFHFGESELLPTRVFAVTGYNGVGKTRLLASLGMVIAAHNSGQPKLIDARRHGSLESEPPDVSAVVCISYSAFDDFEVPDLNAEQSADPDLGRTYHYIGLRAPSESEESSGRLSRALKSFEAIHAEFEAARTQALNKLRGRQLAEIFEPLAREPSFAMAGGLPPLDASPAIWRRAISGFSTGHKIVLNILVQLCATLEKRSLVLIDEPEMHLHPPLVAALLRSMGIALKVNDSFAIMATHSPVVVQEIPGSNVIILRRAQGASTFEEPEIETYGEHIGLLTSRIFNLDNSQSDFRGHLRGLTEERTLDEIEGLFELGLSAQARVIVLSELNRD